MRTWRTIEVYHNKSLAGDSGTETFSLPRTHMIGDLWLVVRASGVSAGNTSDAAVYESIEYALDKITVKSGSKTFKSYDGEMCRLMAAHRDGQLAPATKSMVGSAVNETVFPIHFGIEPQDEDVILPAPLLDSLDLVLDYDFPTDSKAVSGGGSVVGGWVAGSKYFDLYANVLEPTADLENKMILVQEKKQDVTYAASHSTPFDLTLDERRLLRKVYVQAYVAGSAEGVVCENIELKADNEQVMKADWEQIQFQNAVDHKLNYRDHIKFMGTGTGDVYYSKIPDVEAVASDDGTISGPVAGGCITIAGDAITNVLDNNDDIAEYFMRSDVLPRVAIVDFDRDNSMRRLQPQGIRDLDIILYDGATGAGALYEESLQKIW